MEVGQNLRDAGLVRELLTKRSWIKESISLLLTHATYHRTHSEELAKPSEEVMVVGSEEGTKDIAST